MCVYEALARFAGVLLPVFLSNLLAAETRKIVGSVWLGSVEESQQRAGLQNILG